MNNNQAIIKFLKELEESIGEPIKISKMSDIMYNAEYEINNYKDSLISGQDLADSVPYIIPKEYLAIIKNSDKYLILVGNNKGTIHDFSDIKDSGFMVIEYNE